MHTFLSCTGNEVELFFRLTPRPSLSDKVHRPQVHLYRIGQLGTLFVCFSLSVPLPNLHYYFPSLFLSNPTLPLTSNLSLNPFPL